MVTRLEKFRNEMKPAEKIFTKELETFAEKYKFLGEMTLVEDPDIETLDYVYSFEKLNGTSKEVLDDALMDLYNHMIEFSKENGIEEFCSNVIISYNRCYHGYY